MKHRHGFRKLNRHAAHRRSLYSNMANSLLKYSRVMTTLAKAKEIRRVVEKLVTQARTNTLASRRTVLRVLRRPDQLKKLFDVIAPAFADRPGGYTRIIHIGPRRLDNAEMACIEFVQDFAPVKPVASETKTGKDPKAVKPVKEKASKEASPSSEVKKAKTTPKGKTAKE